MKRILALCCVMLTAGDAAACMRSSLSYTFEDKINNEFSYLICLHNEQNEVIRKIGSAMDDLSRGAETREMMMQSEIDRLASKVRSLEAAQLMAPSAGRVAPEAKADVDKMLDEMKSIIDRNNLPATRAPTPRN